MILKASAILSLALLLPCSAARAAAGDSPKTWAFIHPQDHFSSDAMLDLRSLNETTAGESGFVRISADGGFVRGDGTPIRFWACGSREYMKAPDELARHARFLAKIGVNMVRLHAQIGAEGDAPELTDVNEKQIDGIWRAAAAFKKEGIYLTISPYWALDRPAARWGIEGYQRRASLWGLLFFNETLQKGYEAWVRRLYCPTNPYTGIPLARDPAVAILQIQNEDGMFFWTMNAMAPAQKRLLGRKFAAWLEAKYGSLAAASDAWDGVGAAGDDFPAGDVAIMPVAQWTRPQHGGKGRRLADQLQFFAAAQREFYAKMVKFYREELGCRQLINASNWMTADAARLSDVERYTDTAADVLAVNKYFTGTHQGNNTGWRIDPGDCFTSPAAVLNPGDLPTNLKQVSGHPMMVTESSWVSPLDYQNEGPFLTAAYESLSGVAGLYWYTATAEQYADDPRVGLVDAAGERPLRKYDCSTPALMGNFPAAALLYRQEYLKRGEPVVVECRPLEDLWNRRWPLIAEDGGAHPDAGRGADPLAFLVGPVIVSYGGDARQGRLFDLSKFIDRGKKVITSDTGQIRMDYNAGLCTIDAPAAQGATGFLRKAGEVHLSAIDVASGNEQASILVISMDGRALSESRKVLVQVGTPAHLAGWKQEPADFTGGDQRKYHGWKVVQVGRPPWMIDDAEGTVTIHNPNLTRATVLDVSGYPKREMPLPREGREVKLRLPEDAMYLVLQS
ncbi:MAG: hypothetical protein ABSB74_03045 [Tepidisphaeraceae bacterium]